MDRAMHTAVLLVGIVLIASACGKSSADEYWGDIKPFIRLREDAINELKVGFEASGKE